MMVISVRRLLRLLVVLGAGLGLLVPLVVAVGAAPAQADDGGLVPDGLSAPGAAGSCWEMAIAASTGRRLLAGDADAATREIRTLGTSPG